MKKINNFFKILSALKISYLQLALILSTAIFIFIIDFIIFASLGKYIESMTVDNSFTFIVLNDAINLNTAALTAIMLVAAFIVKLVNVYVIGRTAFNTRAKLYLLFARTFIFLNRESVNLYSNDQKFSYLTNITEFLTHNLIMSSLNLISAISYIVLVAAYIILTISDSSGYAYLIFLLTSFIIVKWLAVKSDILKTRVSEMLDREASFSNRIVTGNKEIIHYNVENYTLNTAQNVAQAVAGLKFRSYFLSSVFRPSMELMGLSLIFAMIFMSNASFSSNLTALLFLVKAIPSFQAVVAFLVSFKLCEQPITDARALIEAESVPKRLAVAPLRSFQISEVVVNLDRGDLKLRDISFSLGENYALVGSSGSGKSTLLDILTGYRKFESGTLAVDGRSITNAYIKADYAFQDPMIFNGTILENIVFDRANITPKDTERARELLRLLELEVPLDQRVINYGDNLSGGQKARLSLARALFDPGDIIMIDECFAQIQKDLSIRIIHRLRKIYDCIILISHDDTIVPRDFTKIYNVGEFYDH